MADYIVNQSTTEIVAKALVGREFYVAYKRTSEEGVESVSIVLFLLSKNDGHVGYKDIGEEAQPYYFNCPERILKLSTFNDDNSVAWREKCREHARHKSAWPEFVKSLKPEQSITKHDGVELIFKYAHKNKIICFDTEKKKLFSYKSDSFII